MSRFFFDTEFIENGKTIDLLSIGICCSDGREYYAESLDADWTRASDWVKDNVLPHLQLWKRPDGFGVHVARNRSQIAADILAFVGKEPEFWAYYADYDWVVLCQLYGKMIDLPEGWPMFCMDVKQYAVTLGNPLLPKQSSTEHHALEDARWTRHAWEYLEHFRGSR